ncbi:uncharacterized protein [Ptychodera flava]|uniref:uncharacterized protein isoform X2 n=1 Tax=Ptychodera flava TaxID=63121 RepID=UPI003969D3A5
MEDTDSAIKGEGQEGACTVQPIPVLVTGREWNTTKSWKSPTPRPRNNERLVLAAGDDPCDQDLYYSSTDAWDQQQPLSSPAMDDGLNQPGRQYSTAFQPGVRQRHASDVTDGTFQSHSVPSTISPRRYSLPHTVSQSQTSVVKSSQQMDHSTLDMHYSSTQDIELEFPRECSPTYQSGMRQRHSSGSTDSNLSSHTLPSTINSKRYSSPHKTTPNQTTCVKSNQLSDHSRPEVHHTSTSEFDTELQRDSESHSARDVTGEAQHKLSPTKPKPVHLKKRQKDYKRQPSYSEVLELAAQNTQQKDEKCASHMSAGQSEHTTRKSRLPSENTVQVRDNSSVKHSGESSDKTVSGHHSASAKRQKGSINLKIPTSRKQEFKAKLAQSPLGKQKLQKSKPGDDYHGKQKPQQSQLQQDQKVVVEKVRSLNLQISDKAKRRLQQSVLSSPFNDKLMNRRLSFSQESEREECTDNGKQASDVQQARVTEAENCDRTKQYGVISLFQELTSANGAENSVKSGEKSGTCDNEHKVENMKKKPSITASMLNLSKLKGILVPKKSSEGAIEGFRELTDSTNKSAVTDESAQDCAEKTDIEAVGVERGGMGEEGADVGECIAEEVSVAEGDVERDVDMLEGNVDVLDEGVDRHEGNVDTPDDVDMQESENHEQTNHTPDDNELNEAPAGIPQIDSDDDDNENEARDRMRGINDGYVCNEQNEKKQTESCDDITMDPVEGTSRQDSIEDVSSVKKLKEDIGTTGEKTTNAANYESTIDAADQFGGLHIGDEDWNMSLTLSSDDSDDDISLPTPRALQDDFTTVRSISPSQIPKDEILSDDETGSQSPQGLPYVLKSKKVKKFKHSLDSILAEKQIRAKNAAEIAEMQASVKQSINQGGFAKLVDSSDDDSQVEKKDNDGELLPEHKKQLEKFSLPKDPISDIHPGENVFNLDQLGKLFSFPNNLSLANCGFTPSHSALDQLLNTSSPDDLLEIVLGGTLVDMYTCKPCPNALLLWLFNLMSIHPSGDVSDRLHQNIWSLLNSLADQVHGDQLWVPQLKDVVRVFSNYGANVQSLFPDEVQKWVELADDDLRFHDDKENHLKEASDNSDDTSLHTSAMNGFPTRNCVNCIKMLTHAIATKSLKKKVNSYTDQELVAMVCLACKVALETDIRFLAVQVDFQMCIAVLLECIKEENWSQMVQEICHNLPYVSDSSVANHHHNKVYIVQLMPTNTARGRFLKRRLSYTILHSLLPSNNNVKTQPVDCLKFKVSDLHSILHLCKPSSETDYYHLNSLIMLIDMSVGNEPLKAGEREGLDKLEQKLRSISGDIKESVKCLHRSKVKDLLVRTASKFTFMAQGMTQTSLYSFYKSEKSIDLTEDLPSSSDVSKVPCIEKVNTKADKSRSIVGSGSQSKNSMCTDGGNQPSISVCDDKQAKAPEAE